MEQNPDRRQCLELMRVNAPRSEFDYVRNRLIDRVKSYLLPTTEEVRRNTRPKFYGQVQEADLRKTIRSVYDMGSVRPAETSQLIMGVLKEALLDDREKAGQRVNSASEKGKARYNKAYGLRYGVWERLLDYAHPRMQLDSKSKIDFLNFMFKFNVNVSDDCYKFFSNYKVNGDYDCKKNEKIFDYVNFRLGRPAASKYASCYNIFLENYALNTEKFDSKNLQRLAAANAEIVEKGDDFEKKYDFSALEGYLQQRAIKHPKAVEQELFGKIRLVADRIDKRGLMTAAQVLVDKIYGSKDPSHKLARQSTQWLETLTKKHHFRQEEIDCLKNIFNPEKAVNSENKFIFSSFNNEIQTTYNLRQDDIITSLNQWAYSVKTDDQIDLLSVRSVYVNMLTENLVCDNDIRGLNPDVYYRSHHALVRRQKNTTEALQALSESCEAPKIDNLKIVLNNKYSDRSFYEDSMEVLDCLDSNEKKLKKIKRPFFNRYERHL